MSGAWHRTTAPEVVSRRTASEAELDELLDDQRSFAGDGRERGIEIGGAFGPLAGKAWRIGLMGTNATVPVVHRLVDTLSEVVRRRP